MKQPRQSYLFVYAALIAVGVTALNATPSHASVQVNGPSVVLDGTGSVDVSNSPDALVYDWVSAPFAAYVDFTTSNAFDLFLDEFISNSGDPNSDVTGFILDVLDGPGGTAVSRLTNLTTFADSAPGVLSGNTNLFALPNSGNGNPFQVASTTTPLLSNLDAGSYRLGVYDSQSPDIATATFRIAEVPEAASGLVWLVGLVFAGGVAKLR